MKPTRHVIGAGLVAILALALPLASRAQGGDTDSDGIPDASDNCILVKNFSQCNNDSDGFGNACDADFDNNGMAGASDFARLRAVWVNGIYDPVVDMSCTPPSLHGIDFSLFAQEYLTPPGP